MTLAFTDEDRAHIDEILGRYPHQPAALLPVLHYAQDKFGHLSPEVQLLVAHAIDVPPPRVREVVTFYEMYHEHPEGQFHLEVCTNISCHLMGGDAILDHLRAKLGIECGHHTADGMFSLMEAECLASCGSGVCMKVGRDYYEFLTVDAVDALVERFKKLAPSLKGRPYVGAEPEAHVGPVKGFEPSVLPVLQPTPKKSKADRAAEVAAAPVPDDEPETDPDAEEKNNVAAAVETPADEKVMESKPGSQDLPPFDPPPLDKKAKK